MWVSACVCVGVGVSVSLSCMCEVDTERVINTRYDLKGSTVGRAVSEYEKKQPTTIYKDLDFLQMQVHLISLPVYTSHHTLSSIRARKFAR